MEEIKKKARYISASYHGRTDEQTNRRTYERTNEHTFLFFLPFPKTKPLVLRGNRSPHPIEETKLGIN